MRRARTSWLAFALFSVILLGSTAGISWALLRAEEERETLRLEAAREERVRLALWRLDSTLSPMLGQEDARPARDYLAPIEVRAPMRAYFRLDEQGRLSRPSGAALPALADNLDRSRLEVALERVPRPEPTLLAEQGLGNQGLVQQQVMNKQEFQARNRAAVQTVQMANLYNPVKPKKKVGVDDASGALRALWMGKELLLARRARLDGKEWILGVWLDRPGLVKQLKAEIADLFPKARFVDRRGEPGGRSLATLPLELEPGPWAASSAGSHSAVTWILLLAWMGVLGALFATAILLRGVLELSERRATFVSAVTHELRTPLTTFRLYAEMLAEGMVEDADKQQQYHRTLLAEAERLDHLVHNVLSYARLEKGREGGRRERSRLTDMLERIRPRLEHRLEQVGMELAQELGPGAEQFWLETDGEAVERILFNLVDNAAKYAAAAEDKRVRLCISRSPDGKSVHLDCRDGGPGLNRAARAALFRPFSRSAEVAAGKAPGVGLGLALSRKLARRLGGDLSLLEEKDRGAAFRLRLPLSAG